MEPLWRSKKSCGEEQKADIVRARERDTQNILVSRKKGMAMKVGRTGRMAGTR